jgi:VanZ family protein
MNGSRRRVPTPLRYALAVGYALVVLYTSVTPATGGLPATGPFGVLGLDKWLHAMSYTVFALLLAYAALARSRRTLLVVVAVTVLYGGGMEILQSFVSYRAFDPLDALANAVGGFLGVAGWLAVRRLAIAWRSGRARVPVANDE